MYKTEVQTPALPDLEQQFEPSSPTSQVSTLQSLSLFFLLKILKGLGLILIWNGKIFENLNILIGWENYFLSTSKTALIAIADHVVISISPVC